MCAATHGAHSLMDLRLLNFELGQVRERLAACPGDVDLLKLEKKLHRLIELSSKLGPLEKPPIASQKMSPNNKLTVTPKWRPGDYCESLDREDGQWYKAMVQSIDGDKVTVLFSGTSTAHHCSSAEIRSLSSSSREAKTKQIKSTPRPTTLQAPTQHAPKSSRDRRAERERILEEKLSKEQSAWQKAAKKFGIGPRT